MGSVDSSLPLAVRCLARRRLAWLYPTFERGIASARWCCAQFVLNRGAESDMATRVGVPPHTSSSPQGSDNITLKGDFQRKVCLDINLGFRVPLTPKK